MGKCERFANCSDVSKARTLHIAFLNCDEPGEETKRKHGGFDDIMHSLLEPVLSEAQDEIALVVDGYDVVQTMEYPTDLEPLDAIIISGSFEADAHEDLPWIRKVLDFVRSVHREHARIRLIGICWGHQIIARAFGAKIEPNPAGWEVGATTLHLTDAGKELLNPVDWLDRKTVVIQQAHADMVTSTPDGFELLASSELCHHQAFAMRYEGPPPSFTHACPHETLPYSSVRVLTSQGHPEWSSAIIDPLIDGWLDDGTFSADFAAGAKQRTKQDDDGRRLARSILRILGVSETLKALPLASA